MKQEFSDRIRFNWGYHDAANEHKMRQVPRKLPDDKAYCAGYSEGLQDAKNGNYLENSDFAWKRYQTFKNGITGKLKAAGF